MSGELKKKVLSGLFWSYLERLGTQAVSFIVSIVIARILEPGDYGVVAIVIVFVNLSDVFVQAGFGSALVQKKEVDEHDYSSVFWVSLSVSVLLYILLFFTAPWIADFYELPVLCPLLQVLGFRLPLTSYNLIQRAIVSRSMQFRTYFYSSLVGVVISAVIGIWLAKIGAGVWALVAQQLSSVVVGTIVIALFVRWYPTWIFNFSRLRGLFSYGWKLLAGALIDTFYEDFRSLYVGKLYTPADLAYYSKGASFPALVVRNVNSSINAVLFPAMSRRQDDKIALRYMVRRSIRTCSFVIIPLMFGLIVVAEPLVLVLLTEKWIPCAIFLQILCFDLMLKPIQASNLQAIYAMGRSDIGLKLNIIKKSVGFVVILVTAAFSVEAMAWGGVFSAFFSSFINAYPNKRLLDYDYFAQLKDIFPYVILSAVMGIGVYLIGTWLACNLFLVLGIQFLSGIMIYLGLARLFNLEVLNFLLTLIPIRKNS